MVYSFLCDPFVITTFFNQDYSLDSCTTHVVLDTLSHIWWDEQFDVNSKQ